MLYFTVELFVDALILVLHYRNADVQMLVNKIIEIYEQETKESAYMENEFFDLYIRLIQEVLELKVDPDNATDVEIFLLKFKSSQLVMKDPELYTTLKRIFTDKTTLTKERYQYLMRKLTNSILWYNNIKGVKKMFGKMSGNSLAASPEKQELVFQEMSELCTDLIRMNQDRCSSRDEDENQARLVDFQNIETIAKSLNVFQKTSVTNVFKTGLQGFNRAFGPCGGWRLGESIVFNALSFNGKALAHGTPVRVPGGWKLIEDIRVGDKVIARDGTISTVTGVFPQGLRDVFKITFGDGRSVNVDRDHLWTVQYRSADRTHSFIKSKEMTTLQILERLNTGIGKTNTYIPLCDSEQNPDIQLPINPYLLGVLLGDGGLTQKSAMLDTDAWIMEKIAHLLPANTRMTQVSSKSDKIVRAVFARIDSSDRNCLNTIIEDLGLNTTSLQKKIPDIYLEGSHSQRLSLLQGLFDTDGSINKPYDTVHRSNVEYSTSSEQLANQVQYLVRSIGGMCLLKKRQTYYTYNGEMYQGQPSFRLSIRYHSINQLFTLPRKLERTLGDTDSERQKKLRVVSVQSIAGKQFATCISIDHPEKLFVTKDFIVTHNTQSLLKMARWQVTLNKVTSDFKNPTCIVYSLENETPQNTMMLFTELYINLKKELPPPDMTTEQIINFCYEHFRVHGWRLIVDRRLGAEFGFPELVANFEEYVRLGYTPLMCVIDYMNMLKKGSSARDDGGGNHLLLRDVYTNTCNYLKSRNCTLVTAHQLNRKASEVVRQNPLGAVKKFDIGMLADGMDPQREIDVAIYQNKEFDATGRAFMTYKMDKHRYDTETPDSDKYFAYMFDGPLGILDDIDGIDMSTTNIHSVPFNNSGAGAAAPVQSSSAPINLFGE